MSRITLPVTEGTLGRRAYKLVSASVRAVSPGLGALLLRSGIIRRAMNRFYEAENPRFRYAFAVLFSDVQIRQAFEWQCSWGPRSLSMPVVPTHPRSWNAALVWHWEGHAAIKSLYQAYATQFPAGVLFDVGANDGTHTYPFAVRGYRCFSFEPQDQCVAYIRQVATLNGLSNVTVVHAIVTDESVAEAEYWTSESTWYSSRIKEQTERFETAVSSRAPCVSIDEYARRVGVGPTLLKIDVEGWEAHVLASAAATIAEFRPDILVEIAAGCPEKEAIWTMLLGQGYQCVRISHSPGIPSSRVGSAEAFTGRHGTFNDDFFFSTRTNSFPV